MHVNMHTHSHTYTCVTLWIIWDIRALKSFHRYMCTCIYAYTHKCIYTHTRAHTHTHTTTTRTYTHMYTHTHTHTHTQTCFIFWQFDSFARKKSSLFSVLHYVAVCCSVLQCVAVCCSVLQYVCLRLFTRKSHHFSQQLFSTVTWVGSRLVTISRNSSQFCVADSNLSRKRYCA